MLEVSFVRRRGGRDRVYVRRDDGSSTGWDFPSYGDGLPHDLCHLVVEDELRLTDGFWGLVDQGTEVTLINNQATLTHDGKPLVDRFGVDFSGLNEAEAAVAVLAGPRVAVDLFGGLGVARLGTECERTAATDEIARALGFVLPSTATPDAVAAIGTRLRELAGRWRGLEDGGAVKLRFSRRPLQSPRAP